jgi:hypothetical protein
MTHNDAIHIQVEKGGEDGKVQSINTLKAHDSLYVVHDV